MAIVVPEGQSAAITLDVYSDLFDRDLDSVADELDGAILHMDLATPRKGPSTS
jgi:hypothetical protein